MLDVICSIIIDWKLLLLLLFRRYRVEYVCVYDFIFTAPGEKKKKINVVGRTTVFNETGR